MTERGPSLDRAYFEGIYSGSLDPWGFRTSPYEDAKYAATLAVLASQRYGSALEVGCSIGVLTRRLAGRCDALLAVDASSRALAEAARANADLPHVHFAEAMVPADFPPGHFDLIVLSEVVYYLSKDDVVELAARCVAALRPGGEMVLCHWLGETNYPLSGDEAAETFIGAVAPRWRPTVSRREALYRLDGLGAVT